MKTRMKSDARRASIVDAAIHLFAEKGFRGTTTRELAAALGVTEPVLYQHFANKSDIYTAIIEAKSEEGRHRTAALLARLEGNDDRAFFTHLAELVLDRYHEDTEFIRLLYFSALEGHELTERFYEAHVLPFYDLIAGYVRRRIREGAFREVNPLVAARAFIGMVGEHGTEALFLRRPVKASRKKLVEDIVTLFLNGIFMNGVSR
jgi:AcrR family transcriptional regulator